MDATDVTIATRKPIMAISADTLTIIGMFRALDTPDKILTKTELRATIMRDPMGLVYTAKRHVLKNYGMVIEWDRIAQGWRNMIGADNLSGRKDGYVSLRRKARRESEKLSVVDLTKLTDPQKIEACAVASIFGAVAHIATSSSVRRIENAVEKVNIAGLPLGKTLALFHDNGKATA